MIQRISQNGFSLPQAQKAAQKSSGNFGTVLEKARAALKISAHAQERIQQRNIPFGEAEMARVQNAVEKASAKGSRESLVFLDNNAFVVSVRNRTIVTAMDGMKVKDNVFTNIDSAVIA